MKPSSAPIWDELLVTIQEVEARDLSAGRSLRGLAEQFQYQKLLDLFGPVDPPVVFLRIADTGLSTVPA